MFVLDPCHALSLFPPHRGYVDSIVAAKENSAKFGYAISPNRELVALGAGNFFASFLTVFGAVPTFGSITRSR